MICSCGNHTDNLKSYFHKESQLRVTVCEKCAEHNKLNDENKYLSIPYNELTASQNKTPEPNGSN